MALTTTTLGLFAMLPGCSPKKRKPPNRSRIVRVTNPMAIMNTGGKDNKDLNPEVVTEMVNTGIMAFTGEKTVESAWAKIIPDPEKRVAIKINCQITGIYTKARVVDAVTQGLIQRGVAPDNIVIYDLTDTAFEYAGFKKNTGPGIKIGTNGDLGGYSWRAWHGLPIWRIGQRFSKVLAGEGKFGCDYLINIPVMKALDDYSGVSISMKNHFGSIAGCYELHSTIHDAIAELNAHRLIVEKTRLILVDGIFTEYKWVNGRSQDYIETTNQLLFGNDPVAIDYIGWQEINRLRRQNSLDPVKPEPLFIQKAGEKWGLGNSDMGKIDILDT